MLEKQQIKNFRQSVQEYINTYPEQIKNSINEYLSYIHPSIAQILEIKFTNDFEYYGKFKFNVFYVSQVLILIGQKTLCPNLHIEDILDDFIDFSIEDDRHIFNMKLYYLENVGSAQMQIGQIDLIRSQEVLDRQLQETLLIEAEKRAKACDKAIFNFKKKYLHLVKPLD